MKIEDHVVSLELSKKLDRAGYPQGLGSSNFYWVDKYGDDQWQLIPNNEIRMDFKYFIAAPLASELGEQLSYHILYGEGAAHDLYLLYLQNDTEANSRARIWLYLKKEGLL